MEQGLRWPHTPCSEYVHHAVFLLDNVLTFEVLLISLRVDQISEEHSAESMPPSSGLPYFLYCARRTTLLLPYTKVKASHFAHFLLTDVDLKCVSSGCHLEYNHLPRASRGSVVLSPHLDH